MSLFSLKKTNASSKQEDSLQQSKVTEILYKRNSELAIKNKALSLLGQLYETSILSISPSELARQISESVLGALNYESVSVLLYDHDADTLTQAGAAHSERYEKQLQMMGFATQENPSIENISSHDFFAPLIQERKPIFNQPFGFLMRSYQMDADNLKRLAENAHIKSALAYPLSQGDRVIGLFHISMNRYYGDLPGYERVIIENIANVISLAMGKSLIYEELRIANEKLQSLDKLKTEFLSLASHQLRSPLTAIKGYTSMLLDGSFGDVSAKQKEAIDRVYQSSIHLTKVVEDLLNVSKIEQGGMKYEMVSFDLEKAAHDLATDLSITAQKKGLALTFETDHSGPYMIMGDMEKLRQVILNIIDNAIKYTPSGSIKVRLGHTADRSMVRLDVTDTGMGIAPAEKEKLFQKFSRGAGGKINTGGSGLGLYLAKEIVEAHKGRIGIDSPGTGLGSTFSIELASE